MSIKEALEEVGDLYYGRGFNAAHSIVNSPTDADIAAAEAVVLALYEQQKAIADELAEALSALVPLANCGWEGDCCPGAECTDDPDCAAITGKVRAAIAHYKEAQ